MSHLQYQRIATPLHVPDVTDPVVELSWKGQQPDRHIYRRPPDFPAYVVSAHIPDVTDPAPELAWKGHQADRHTPAPGRYMRTPDFPAFTMPRFVPDMTNPVTAMSWTARYPDRLPRIRRPREVANWFLFTPPVVVIPGGSSAAAGSQLFIQYQDITGPVLFSIPSDESLHPQGVRGPDVVYRRRFHASLQQAFTMDWQWDAPVYEDNPEELAWTFRVPDMAHPKRSIRTASQQFFNMDWRWLVPPLPLLPPWEDLYDQRTFEWVRRPPYPAAVYRWAQPMFGVEVAAPVLSWAGKNLGLAIRRKATNFQLSLNVAPLYLADITVVAPELGWRGIQPDWIVRSVNRRAYQQYLVSVLRATTYHGADGCGVF